MASGEQRNGLTQRPRSSKHRAHGEEGGAGRTLLKRSVIEAGYLGAPRFRESLLDPPGEKYDAAGDGNKDDVAQYCIEGGHFACGAPIPVPVILPVVEVHVLITNGI